MAKDKITKEDFERIQVEPTDVIDVSKLVLSDEYTEETLQWFTIGQLHDIIKHKDLPKDTLKLVRKVIKQKKHEK